MGIVNKTVKKIYLAHENFWSKDGFVLLVEGILFFIFALLIQHFSYEYVDNKIRGTAVDDLLLNNLPILNLDFFIVQAPLLLTLVIAFLFLANPRYLSFSLKTLALFLIIRSFFIVLTHLGANLHQVTLDTNSFGFSVYDFLYNSKNDFFFSGHVGLPFLFGLIFWKKTFWRFFFFAVSGIFGLSMIFAHMHYSIDIFAAPFITYGIFVISKKAFKKDLKLII